MMRLYQGETGVNTNISLTSNDRGWFKIESCLEHLRFCSTLEQGLSAGHWNSMWKCLHFEIWCSWSYMSSSCVQPPPGQPCFWLSFKGVLHFLPPKSSKISMFCALPQNYQHLFEKWYMHLLVNCPRNSKITTNLR